MKKKVVADKPVRLQRWLKSAIDAEAVRLSDIGTSSISAGDIVQKAWAEYLLAHTRKPQDVQISRNPTQEPRNIPGIQRDKDNLNSVSVTVVEAELPCVLQVVEILRSGNIVAVEAIQAIISAVHGLSGARSELATPIADADPDTGDRFSARIQEVDSAATRSGQDIDRLEKANEERKEPAQRDKLGDN